ncbi:hypothetical protein Tco_1429240 [Tanacetum coccineum]
MNRTNRRTRVSIGLYPCHTEEKMTIKEVRGESVMEWKTKVTAKEGTFIKIPGKFCGYKLSTEEEEMEIVGTMDVPTRLSLLVTLRSLMGAIALTRWIEKMESVFDNSGCTANQRVRALLVEELCPSKEMEKLENKFWNHTKVGANHVAYTDRFHELAKLVPRLVTSKSSRIKRILTDEDVHYGTLTKGNDKRKEMEESSKQGSTGKDNKKSKTGSGFVAIVPPSNNNKPGHYARQCWTPIRLVAPMNAVRMRQNQRACYEYGSLDHICYDCPKWKQATGQARNPLALEGNRNTRNNGNQVRGRAFNGNAVEAL